LRSQIHYAISPLLQVKTQAVTKGAPERWSVEIVTRFTRQRNMFM
jgi:hypothetical protein